MAVTWEKQRGLCIQIPVSIPPSLEQRVYLPSKYRESYVRVYDLLQGKVRKSFPYLPFPKFLQLEIFNMPRFYILG